MIDYQALISSLSDEHDESEKLCYGHRKCGNVSHCGGAKHLPCAVKLFASGEYSAAFYRCQCTLAGVEFDGKGDELE